EWLALVAHEGICGERGEAAPDGEQRAQSSGHVLSVELRDLLLRRSSDLRASRHAVPGRVHAVHEVPGRRLAVEEHERLDSRAFVHGWVVDAEALRLVHAAAASGDGRERLAPDRVPDAAVGLHHPRAIRPVGGPARNGHALTWIRIRTTADVLDDAPSLPRLELAKLLGIGRGIAGEPEGLDGEDGGGGVMAMRGCRLRGEPRDDDVGTELADHPHDVAEDRLSVPDGERLLGVLRVAEILGAGEVLPSSVQAARGEQLLRARHPERLAELGPEQVLSAVAA